METTTNIFQINANNVYEINYLFVKEEAERLQEKIKGDYQESLGDEFNEETDLPQWATISEIRKQVESDLDSILHPEFFVDGHCFNREEQWKQIEYKFRSGKKLNPEPERNFRKRTLRYRREEKRKNLPVLYNKED